jgi:DNA-binding winged helix-turn-helix (wHTH) protein/tetratricopeptide (TPR) repeat protein
MTDTAVTVLRFNDCELDLAARELRRADQVVPLEPRVFALLEYLYEQRHRAVNKDEIQDAVWKGVIVSETALTRAIMKARRAVNDSADQQAVIRTVHGHGYQFVARLQEADPAATPEPSAETPRRNSFTPRLLAACVALAILGFVYYLWPAATPPQTVRLAVMPVVNATADPEYDWTRLGLMGFANDLISRSASIEVLPASDVVRFTEQAGWSGDRDDATVANDLQALRDRYGASHLLSGTLEKNAGVIRLSYSLYKLDGDTDRGTMVGAEPTELIRGMIRSVVAALGKQVRDAREITVISEDPFINEAYSRGLGFALEGRCAEALPLFDIVIAGGNTAGRAELEAATCARILGQWQKAEAAFREILAKQPAEPASSLRAQAFNGLGTVYIRTGRSDEARATYELGLAESIATHDYRVQGMLLNSLAIDAKNRREYDKARELLARATLAYRESDAGILPGQVPAALANIDMAEGKLEQADDHLAEALASFRALGDRRNEAMMLNNYGYLRRLQGRLQDAEPMHLQSLSIRKEINDRVGQGRILGMLSTIYEDDGRLDEARAAATEAYEIAREANDRLFMATSLAQLAQVEQSAGDNDAARQAYTQSMAIFEQIEDHSRAAQVAIRIGRLDLQADDYAAAQQSTDAVLELAIREALHEPAIEALELRGDIALQQANLPAATLAYRNALDYVDESGFIAAKTRLVVKLANCLLDQRDSAATEPLLGYVVEQDDTVETLRLRARFAYQAGDAARAVELLDTARQLPAADWSDDDAQTLARYRQAATSQ